MLVFLSTGQKNVVAVCSALSRLSIRPVMLQSEELWRIQGPVVKIIKCHKWPFTGFLNVMIYFTVVVAVTCKFLFKFGCRSLLLSRMQLLVKCWSWFLRNTLRAHRRWSRGAGFKHYWARVEVGFKEVGFKGAAVQLVSHDKNGTVCTVYTVLYKSFNSYVYYCYITFYREVGP